MKAAPPDTCSTHRLSAFADGDLSAGEAQIVRAHVAACPRCTAALADLAAIVRVARELDRPEPPPTLWGAIAGALEDERPRRRLPWLTWRPFALGGVAGAAAVALAILIVPAARGRFFAPDHELAAADASAGPVAHDPLLVEAEAEFAEAAAAYERSIAKLRALLAREEARWSAGQRAWYAERLAQLDEAIARSRELARRSPGDGIGNEQLFAAYQQKLAFLTAAVHRGADSSGPSPSR
jgi:hypothetical protein